MTRWSSAELMRRDPEDAELASLVETYLSMGGVGSGRYAMERARLGDRIREELDRRGGEAVIAGRRVHRCGGRLVIGQAGEMEEGA